MARGILDEQRFWKAWQRLGVHLEERELLPVHGRTFVLGWEPGGNVGRTFEATAREWGSTRWRITFAPADHLTIFDVSRV
jgi:hypothetical protein